MMEEAGSLGDGDEDEDAEMAVADQQVLAACLCLLMEKAHFSPQYATMNA